MATKLDRIVTYLDRPLHIKSNKNTRSFDKVVLQGHVKYISCCITTTKACESGHLLLQHINSHRLRTQTPKSSSTSYYKVHQVLQSVT